MTGRLDGRVIIGTGAGRGIGRDYALLAEREGARVIVNDVGAGLGGEKGNERPADQMVADGCGLCNCEIAQAPKYALERAN